MSIVIQLVSANTAVQLGKEVTKLLGFNYSLIGSPFAIDSVIYQMVSKGDDSETPNRYYDVLIRYGELTMPQQLDERLGHGWKLYGNVFTLGRLPVQAVTKGHVPVIGETNGVGDGKDWTDYIDTGDKQTLLEANGHSDAELLAYSLKVDAKISAAQDAADRYEQANEKAHAELRTEVKEAVVRVDTLVSTLGQRVLALETEVSRLGNLLAMEENERKTDVARLQEQIDAITGKPATIPVEPQAQVKTSDLPDESVWR